MVVVGWDPKRHRGKAWKSGCDAPQADDLGSERKCLKKRKSREKPQRCGQGGWVRRERRAVSGPPAMSVMRLCLEKTHLRGH